jgi:ABC-type nitrate/sulfonate/bicarbonate transport system substrate-binding protein
MVAVSRDGEKCSTFADCKDLLAGGTNIDYDGASGAIDFLDVGEPGTGIYEVYEYDAGGVQEVIDELTFQAGAAPTQAAPAPAGIGLNKLDSPVTMTTTCAPSIASLVQWIAVDEGFYADRNLTLECVQIGSGPETAAALAAGEADFAANIYNNVFPLLNGGLEVVVFMETLLYNLFDVIVDADYAAANGITSGMDWQEAMEALDCTNVGVVARGAAAEDLARILIQAAGLDEECFTYVAVGLQPLPGLESGDTDWTVTFDPFQVVAVETGAGVNPFSIQQGEGPPGLDWPGLVYMTGMGNFDSKQAELCAYKSGTVEAVAWLADPANLERAGEIAATRLAEALHPLIPALMV